MVPRCGPHMHHITAAIQPQPVDFAVSVPEVDQICFGTGGPNASFEPARFGASLIIKHTMNVTQETPSDHLDTLFIHSGRSPASQQLQNLLGRSSLLCTRMFRLWWFIIVKTDYEI